MPAAGQGVSAHQFPVGIFVGPVARQHGRPLLGGGGVITGLPKPNRQTANGLAPQMAQSFPAINSPVSVDVVGKQVSNVQVQGGSQRAEFGGCPGGLFECVRVNPDLRRETEDAVFKSQRGLRRAGAQELIQGLAQSVKRAIQVVGARIQVGLGPEEINGLVSEQPAVQGQALQEGCGFAAAPVAGAQHTVASGDFKATEQVEVDGGG